MMRNSLVFALALVSTVGIVVSSETTLPLICYYEGWSPYRNGGDRGHPSIIPVDNGCTHIIYSFMGLDESTNRVKYLDTWQDLDKGAISDFVALKQGRPSLKTTFAIGGWNEGSEKYSRMAASAAGRKAFADSIAELISKHNFDGVDLDWEYPNRRGGRPEDKENFILLLQAIREAIGDDKLLTIAASANPHDYDDEYDVPRLSPIVSFIHVMSYDLRGVWDGVTGNHALLDVTSTDKGILRDISVRLSMEAWVKRGAPKNKLILGFGFYGRTFTTQSASDAQSMGTTTYSAGNAGPISQTPGMLFYSEICRKIKNEGYKVVFDQEGKVPYAYSGNQWIGYDNAEGFKHKVDLIKSEGYAGAMVWAIGTDDVSGSCGEGKFPLLRALRSLLNGGNDDRENVTESSVSTTASATTNSQTTSEISTSSDSSETSTSSESTETSSESSAASTMKPIVRCEKATYPHEKSCKRFYLCDNGRANKLIEVACPPGLVFNAVIGVCDWAANTQPSPANCPDFF